MTIEQLEYTVWFILALGLSIFIAYYVRRRRVKFPVGLVMVLVALIITFVYKSFEGDATGILFLWFSCIIGLSLALDVLTSRGKELNEKLVASSWLVVTSLGGILTNAYIFSVPASLGARIFSLSVLILVHVPILFALIAYLKGKKELSKRLINLGYARGMKNGA